MKKSFIQKELFEEFRESKRMRQKPSAILPKNFILFNINYEQMIFVAIAVIMLMVLVFSLGVERGKSLASNKKEIKIVSAAVEKEIAPVAASADTAGLAAEAPEPVIEKKATGFKLFTVQIGTYRSKRLAQQELIKLTKRGFSPFIIVGGGYYQICVGEYENKKKATKGLLELKKNHKDSFIRKR